MTINSIFLSTLLIFSTAFLFSSCKSSKKVTDLTDDQKLARVWMMTEMDVNETNNFTKECFIKAKVELNLTNKWLEVMTETIKNIKQELRNT